MEKFFQYYIVNRKGEKLFGPYRCRRDAEEDMPKSPGFRIARFEVTYSIVEVK